MTAPFAHVLVVANKTAATRRLADAVRDRAARGPVRFHLLVPNPALAGWRPSELRHPNVSEGEQVLALALPLLREASCSVVEGSVSVRHDPLDAIEHILQERSFDEILLSALPHAVSMWLHVDLPTRVAQVSGLPVSTVYADR